MTELTRRKTDIDQSLTRKCADAEKLPAFLVADKIEIPADLSDFISADTLTEQAIRSTHEAFSALAQTFSHTEAILSEKVAALRAEAASVESDIRKLRTDDRETSVEAEAPNGHAQGRSGAL